MPSVPIQRRPHCKFNHLKLGTCQSMSLYDDQSESGLKCENVTSTNTVNHGIVASIPYSCKLNAF